MQLLNGAYRVLFPAAGLFAALAIPFWLVIYMGAGPDWPADPLRWHMHEMLFGYLSAALGGFLLTAIPNWTGRKPLVGRALLGLFSLWILGRIAMLVLDEGIAQSAIALSFLVVLAAMATREIVLGGNKRNLPMAGMIWLMVVAQALFLFGMVDLGQRIGFGMAMMMIVLIGGRVTPTFTRNWLRTRGVEYVVPEFGAIDKVAMVLSVLAVVSWVVVPGEKAAGMLAVLAGAAVLARLLRWQGWTVAREPLLCAMHLAYGWVAVALVLLGMMQIGTGIGEYIGPVHVFHAIGAGAIGTMTLIIMMRAILGHNNMPIVGTWVDGIILGAVHLAAIVRIFAADMEVPMMGYHMSGMLWFVGFAMFFAKYGRIAMLPRV